VNIAERGAVAHRASVRSIPVPSVRLGTRPLQGDSSATTGAFILVALDASPDVAGYLVYRARPVGPRDLRWFGPDPVHPRPGDPGQAATHASLWRPLSLTAAMATATDRRCQRPAAYAATMTQRHGEVAMPTGAPRPDPRVSGSTFAPATPNHQPGAFNYWIPGSAGGTAQLVTTRPSSPRHPGHRAAARLGRAWRWSWSRRTRRGARAGLQPVLRTAFVDGLRR